MNTVRGTCKFNFGFEMEASGSKGDKPFNMHCYWFHKYISFSPTKKFFPFRLAFGSRQANLNFYINIGILNWNFLIEYKSKEFINELQLIIKNICKNKFTISIVNILKVKNKKFYIWPFNYKEKL